MFHGAKLGRVMRRNQAFTLVEIMIAVSIIALVAVIALPSFLRARQQAQNAKFVNALRVATGAFEMYNIEHNGYPADVNRGVVPSEMALYFGPTFDWTQPTPVGGNWDWDNDVFGFRAGVSVIGSSAPVTQFLDVDRKIDDGNLSQGHFQNTASARYTDILE
jgi:prepilin-type N-terminal cleavage/methylation domain-containing protein